MSLTTLLKEAMVVGVVTAIFGLVISTLFMLQSKDFSFQKYDFWPRVMLSYFVTGFLLHMIFEKTGANSWYCKHGNACMKE